MKKTVIVLLFICLASCASSPSYVLPEGLADVTPVNPLACRFEKQLSNDKSQHKTNWYFWREKQRTETRDELSNQGEIWESKNPNEFFYTRLFYTEHVALEFVQGDLATSGSAPKAQQLNSLIDPQTLGKELKLLNKDNLMGVDIEYYQGTINHMITEVDWLPKLQLPARILKKLPDGVVTLTLSECGNSNKFTPQPITKAEIDNFRRLDYTDLGDMEDDPIVQRIEQLMGGHHHD